MKYLNSRILSVIIVTIAVGVFFYAKSELNVFDRKSKSESLLQYLQTPQVIPELRFMNRKNREITLQAFRGSFVLLNIWATWCGPCREEMPALDRLQKKLGGADFHVLALSIDETSPSVIKKFYKDLNIESLFIYQDPTGNAFEKLKLTAIPSTILIDRSGKGIGYVVGPVEWDSPVAISEIKSHLDPANEINQ